MFKRILDGWKRGARAAGKAQTFLIMTLLYFLVIPLFSFIRFKDPLRKSMNPLTSFWEGKKPSVHTIERLRHPF